jgi:hypothetical protein
MQISSKRSVRLASTQENQEIQTNLRRREVDLNLTSIFVTKLLADGELSDSVFRHSMYGM